MNAWKMPIKQGMWGEREEKHFDYRARRAVRVVQHLQSFLVIVTTDIVIN